MLDHDRLRRALVGMTAEHDIDLGKFLDHLHVLGEAQFGQHDDETGAFRLCSRDRRWHFLVAHGKAEAGIEGLRLLRHDVAGEAHDGHLHLIDFLDDVGLMYLRTQWLRRVAERSLLVVVVEVHGHGREISLGHVAVGIGYQAAGGVAGLVFMPRHAVHPGDRGAVVGCKFNDRVRGEALPVDPRAPAEVPVTGRKGVDTDIVHPGHDEIAQREQHLRTTVRAVADSQQQAVRVVIAHLVDERGQLGQAATVRVHASVREDLGVRVDVAMHVGELYQGNALFFRKDLRARCR